MSEWQPIETAPKDGTLVLLYGRLDPHPTERKLYGALDQSTRVTGYFDDIDEAWAIMGSTWLGPWVVPTHWMPLPPHPKDQP